jgi:DNA-binding GntR family transcriptional regulator
MATNKREVLSHRVYLKLREMIANYRFQPGAWLNVEKLSKQFGVSRIPLWEAVRRLEQEGLVKNIPNRGVFMTETTPEMAFSLFQVREVLEGLAGRLAADRADAGMLRKLARCIEALGEALARPDPVRYARLNYRFHSLIYRGSGNPFLAEMLDSLKMKMRPMDIEIMPVLSKLHQDHAAILKALEARDPRRTEKILVRHIRKLTNHIRRQMEAGSRKG